jgi:hypothetical protein
MTPTSKNETTTELKEMVDKWFQSNCIISEIKENWNFFISPKKVESLGIWQKLNHTNSKEVRNGWTQELKQ